MEDIAYVFNSRCGKEIVCFIGIAQLREPFSIRSVNSFPKRFRVLCVLQNSDHHPRPQKGVVTMETKIIIHNDFCTNANKAAIQIILSAGTELITEAILRSNAEEDDQESAA